MEKFHQIELFRIKKKFNLGGGFFLDFRITFIPEENSFVAGLRYTDDVVGAIYYQHMFSVYQIVTMNTIGTDWYSSALTEKMFIETFENDDNVYSFYALKTDKDFSEFLGEVSSNMKKSIDMVVPCRQ